MSARTGEWDDERSSRNGCTGCLALPFVMAHRVFRPSRPDRIRDSGIERAQIARTAIGIVATLWMIFAYPLRESAVDVVGGKFTEVFLSTGILLIAGPLALAAFVLSARPPVRALYRRRLTGPLRGFAALFGCAGLLFLVTSGAFSQIGAAAPVALLGTLLGLFAALFALPFGITAAVLSVHYVFRTADVHEVLPPLISPLLVWSMFAFQIFDSPPVAAPAVVRALFLIGPPLSVTLLSVWELRRLRMRFGITLGRALLRHLPG
ncbi:hypothetical protein ACFVWX_23570 [Streptomyces sp. NPDC058220]|uniref:hypothetical protein n=1 Tax=unclassified Streptomyces TaxID=2593676 RepID=UPI0036652661